MTGLAAKIGATAFLGPIGAFFGKVPRWCWIALACAVAIAGGLWWHHGKVKAYGNERFAAGYNAAAADIQTKADKLTAKAKDLKQSAEQAQGRVNSAVEKEHEKAAADTRALAAALRLRQPPAPERHADAAGGNGARLPGAPSVADGAAGGINAGMAEVPWLPLVDHAEQCDLDRDKLSGLQKWVRDQSAVWAKWKANAEKAK